MKDIVAIVGSHPRTSRDFDFDRTDCDTWVFNEALNTDWCKRADGVFQIHKPVIWKSSTNRNDPNHYKWLKSGETPVIFMQEKYSDVPKAEKFPLEEIFDKFPEAERYFTSSVAYAIALAVYRGYKRIEIYGVEMETNTEYGHQRVGVAYWCGIAAGRGIEVDDHGGIMKAPLYGYDGDIQIPLRLYENRIGMMSPHILGARGAFENVKMLVEDLLDDFIKTYKTDLSELDAMILAMGQNNQNLGMFEGSQKLNEHYLEKCKTMLEETGTYLIVRQEYESEMNGAKKRMQKANGIMHSAANTLQKKRNALNTNDAKPVRERLVKEVREWLKNYTHATYELGKLNGIARENLLLLKEYDDHLKAAGVDEDQAQLIINQPEGAVA